LPTPPGDTATPPTGTRGGPTRPVTHLASTVLSARDMGEAITMEAITVDIIMGVTTMEALTM